MTASRREVVELFWGMRFGSVSGDKRVLGELLERMEAASSEFWPLRSSAVVLLGWM